MQALILAGGEGTRLRPLTTTVPKPVVPLVDRPFIRFMLDWLRGHGVDDVVMSCGHLAERRAQRARRRQRAGHQAALRGGAAAARHRRRAQVRRAAARRALPDAQRRRADRPRPDRADRAARAHRRARDAGADSGRGPVGVRARAARTTTARSPSSSRSRRPTRSTRNNISAGAYVLERSVLELLEAEQPASIERDVFPRLVGEGLYGCVVGGLLARHRDARALPAGHLRHPRGHGRDGGRRAHGRRRTCASRRTSRTRGRIIPSALVESGCRIGARRADRRARRARARRHASARTRRSSAPWSCRAPRSAATAR